MGGLSDAVQAEALAATSSAVVAVLAEIIEEAGVALTAIAEAALARAEHDLADQALDAASALTLKAERLVALAAGPHGGAGGATSPGGSG